MLRHNLPCEELRTRYQAGQSTTSLARHFGCSPTTISKHLRACGVTLRLARFLSIPVDEATLRRLYLEERLPVKAIAAYFAVSASTIGNKRRLYHIPVRPRHQ
jgi:hypothetical protein